MSHTFSVVTGATGLLGSHLVEQLVEHGERVRAIVRPDSDLSFLHALDVEVVETELGNLSSVRAAVENAETVYHCAARVSEWGAWHEFRRNIIDLTHHVITACQRAGVGRLLHVSSSRVYGHPKHAHVTEADALGQRLWWLWDYYPRAKIESEKLCTEYAGDWTIVRPTWLYGPRDRNSLPRLVQAIARGQAVMVGSGENALNILYAGDAARGAILAAQNPSAVKQVYNLGASESFTQRQFLAELVDIFGLPAVRRRVPYWLAYEAGFALESIAKTLHTGRPRITRHAVSLLNTSIDISSEKARSHLRWKPEIPPDIGLRRSYESVGDRLAANPAVALAIR